MAPPRERTADPTLRLETDILIFDHITYDTTKALLQYAKSQQMTSRGVKRRHSSGDAHGSDQAELNSRADAQLPQELENMLQMVDCRPYLSCARLS